MHETKREYHTHTDILPSAFLINAISDTYMADLLFLRSGVDALKTIIDYEELRIQAPLS